MLVTTWRQVQTMRPNHEGQSSDRRHLKVGGSTRPGILFRAPFNFPAKKKTDEVALRIDHRD